MLHARWHRVPQSCEPVRLPFFCGDLFHDFDFEISFGQKLLQHRIFLRHVLHIFDLIRIHFPKPFAPGIDALLANTVSLGYLGYWTFVRLAQNTHYLFVAVSALLHARSLSGSYLLKFQMVRKYPGRSEEIEINRPLPGQYGPCRSLPPALYATLCATRKSPGATGACLRAAHAPSVFHPRRRAWPICWR